MIKYIVKNIVEIAKEGKTVAFPMNYHRCTVGNKTAKDIDKEFDFVNRLPRDFYPRDYYDEDCEIDRVGDVVTVGNLIGLCYRYDYLSPVHYSKYDSCFNWLKFRAKQRSIKEIYLPKFCDGTDWEKITKSINWYFSDDYTIYVCVLTPKMNCRMHYETFDSI